MPLKIMEAFKQGAPRDCQGYEDSYIQYPVRSFGTVWTALSGAHISTSATLRKGTSMRIDTRFTQPCAPGRVRSFVEVQKSFRTRGLLET